MQSTKGCVETQPIKRGQDQKEATLTKAKEGKGGGSPRAKSGYGEIYEGRRGDIRAFGHHFVATTGVCCAIMLSCRM